MLRTDKASLHEIGPIFKSRISAAQLDSLAESASEMVLFGSMAASLATPHSDLDVLIVSEEGVSFKSNDLDVVGITKRMRESKLWLGSELAQHIKAYGIWLKGSLDFSDTLSQHAIDSKEARIQRFLRSLDRSWFGLDEIYRMKYATKLRRETQRLILLEKNIPIPPTRLLDYQWETVEGNGSVLNRLEMLSYRDHSKVYSDLERRIRDHFETESVNRASFSVQAKAALV